MPIDIYYWDTQEETATGFIRIPDGCLLHQEASRLKYNRLRNIVRADYPIGEVEPNKYNSGYTADEIVQLELEREELYEQLEHQRRVIVGRCLGIFFFVMWAVVLTYVALY